MFNKNIIQSAATQYQDVQTKYHSIQAIFGWLEYSQTIHFTIRPGNTFYLIIFIALKPIEQNLKIISNEQSQMIYMVSECHFSHDLILMTILCGLNSILVENWSFQH